MSAPRSPSRRPIPSDLRVLAEGLAFPEGPIALQDGTVILVEVRGGKLSRVWGDGGHEVVAELGGGPNGAAIGPDGAVYVCNNGGMAWTLQPDGNWAPGRPEGSSQADDYAGGRIERVELDSGQIDVVYSVADGVPLRGPNDLIFDSSGSFWFTDTGKTRARDRDHGGLFYAAADGSRIEVAAHPLQGPNGVGLSPGGTRLYVAESPTGRLRIWDLERDGVFRSDGHASRGEVLMRLPGIVPFDSLAVDETGSIIAGVPGDSALAVISPDGDLEFIEMPDLMPTNIAFGGPEHRTALVTLGWTGKLVSFQWHCRGVALPFQA